ncbi:MAG: hypothetical protein CL610_26625 [Anaerolineaceae bacterium]|nr:hypothetical protein [Anaerolineaceae bacterium]
MDQLALASFANRIAGEVIAPDHAAYDDLRTIVNRKDARPSLIVQVRTHDDIAAAIRFSAEHQLRLAVRSGGHGLTGLATNDGGLVIDLSHFDSVEVLDASSQLVRIGAGATWGNAAKALAAHGLAISSGDTQSVGVGGLTLGGGIGWLVRKYGLTIDSLVAAEMVTADGRALRVSADEHPDLFWALRGGGGNFGVVTSFDFRAQAISSVTGGMIIYDVAELGSVLTKWATYMRTAPEELSSTFVAFPGFGPNMPPQIFVLVCYAGADEAAANDAIGPLLQLGAVVQQNIALKPYHMMLEEAPPAMGVRMVSESGYIKSLDEDVIGVITANHGRAGTPVIQIRSLGGALRRVDPAATAYAWRDYEAAFWSVALVPNDTPQEQIEQIRQNAWRALKPLTTGAYMNFLSDAGESSVRDAYPPDTYNRLARVKALYDPANVFNQNHNIQPVPALQPE